MNLKKKLLLIDDEPLVLELFQTFFESKSFEVTIANTSKVAKDKLANDDFDAVICDVMLEDLDGFDLLKYAKNRQKSVNFILITGSPTEKDKKFAESFDAKYLSKPIGFDTLLSALQP